MMQPGGNACHGDERNNREVTEVFAHGSHFYTTVERFCAHCGTWVTVSGVTGELLWMGTHRDGNCRPTA